MSWFKLKDPMGTNYRVDPGDIMNTKRALNHLGYYDVPPHRGIDDWTDDAMFNGIRSFQKDNGLKVDALMRPGGPTEGAINARLGGLPGGEDDPERSPSYTCTRCGALHGGVFSPTLCFNCVNK
ncbi:peptidoglycan-binding domain-containing protein [Magnetospirillum sp. LM-5]|uniref:peptidoglycan-binding domain-containing protein n=1 Tax=Magnetospirillum sp. LM-5 TaxID=2681466 RepID=UPI001570370F|nr:peptidoglycan-binding domain-containing protein [Magnetospirillum sp. LM-5]